MRWLAALAVMGVIVRCVASCDNCADATVLECPKLEVSTWCHGGGLAAGDCALENTKTLCPAPPCAGQGIVFDADPSGDQAYTEEVKGLDEYTLNLAGYADDPIDLTTIQVTFDGAKAACSVEVLGDRFFFTCPIPQGATVVSLRRTPSAQAAPGFILQVEATLPCRMEETEFCQG